MKIFLTCITVYICPNRNAMHECKQGLGGPSINFNNKACRPVPTLLIYVYGKQEPQTGTVWTFTYKEVGICACVAAKRPEYSSNFNVFHCFWMIVWRCVRHSVWIWCDVFFAAGWCASIRACASIRTYSVCHVTVSKCLKFRNNEMKFWNCMKLLHVYT